jgi:hypothetical protein
VGPGGSDRSNDGGATWTAIGDEGFHALSIERGGRAAWAVGEKGSIARLVLKPTAAAVTIPPGTPLRPALVPTDGPRTMRLDYFHTGNDRAELFSVDRVVVEPAPWAGNKARPIDDTNLGKYFFEVRDPATNQPIYSRGFDSIYGEWETTTEAKVANRTFHESLRFPAPSAPVQVVVKKRDAQNAFREVWTTLVNPADIYVDRSAPPSPGAVIELQRTGDPGSKVDLLFLGEGYTSSQRAKCEADLRRLTEGLFTFSPFKERRGDFNVWGICAAAPESGVSRPSRGQVKRTLFGSSFDAFGTERYALSFDNKSIREVASFAPYDVLGIVMNESAYGNGGIFGQYAGVSIDYPSAIPVFVHEFGHHFAAVGDEYYYNSGVAYAPRTNVVEPWEPNITALLDPANLKWKSLVAAGTPLPTPWPKDEYERSISETPKKVREMRAAGKSNEEIAAYRKAQAAITERSLNEGAFAGKVGAFEGALYEEKGYYRPEQRCIMISGNQFCAVCRAAISRIVDLYSK